MKLSIVVPCYNEAKSIPLLLERFDEVLPNDDIEVILVNNGSTDESQSVIDACIGKYPFVQPLRVEKNQGYGFGVLSGLREARGTFMGWTHADLQTDPRDVVTALRLIEQHGDSERLYIKGNRKNRPWVDRVFTIGMSLFESVYLQARLNDINAQPNVFHRSFYESWDSPPFDFSLDLYALYRARKRGLEIVRFPVMFPERLHGESSWNTSLKSKWGFIKRTVQFSSKLKRDLVS